MKSSKRRDLNFELNLVSFIDLLCTLICFLLVTAAWIHIGSLDVSQAIGGQSVDEAKKDPISVWAYLNPKGEVVLMLKNTATKLMSSKLVTLGGVNGDVAWDSIEAKLKGLRESNPGLKTALVMPSAQVPYENVIRLVDNFKKFGVSDVGVAPL